MTERHDGETRDGGRARLGCILALLTLAGGVAIGVALALGVLGVSWGILFGRIFNPGGTPGIEVGAFPTARPQAIGGAAPGRRYLPVPPIALDTDTALPDMLVISRNFERDTSTLAYMSPGGDGVRWESAPLGDGNEYSWVVAYSDDVVMVASDTRLVGLSRTNGEQIWEAPLTDAISPNICADCLQVFDDVVVALPQDGELQAFSVANGAPRWQVKLREATRQIVRAGDLVGVPDEREDDTSGSVLRLFNPGDGAEAEPFKPTCPERDNNYDYDYTPSYYSPIGQDPDHKLLLWMISSSSPCLLSVDAETRQVVGRTYLEAFSGGEITPETSLWAGGTLYLSDGRHLAEVAPQGMRVLLSEEDYTFSPLAADGSTLLVMAQRTRGSSRYELWAIEIASGERRWERVFTATDPMMWRGDTGTFTAMIVGDAVAVLEEQDDEQLVYELIGLSDGASRVRTAIPTAEAGDDMRATLWGREQMVLVTDELYLIELASGQVKLRWPEDNF